MEQATASEPRWAIVELMGHLRYGGLISKDNQFGTAMLRVDVPMADGAMVSQLINPASLYRITLCSEDLARAAAAAGDPRPMAQWELGHLVREPDPARLVDVDDPEDPDEDF